MKWIDQLSIVTDRIRKRGVNQALQELEGEAEDLIDDELVPRKRRRREYDSGEEE